MCCFAGILTVALMGCNRAESGQNTDAGQSTGGNAENTADAKGRYVETQLPTPEGFSGVGCIGRLQDGSLLLIDKKKGTKSSSDDGEIVEYGYSDRIKNTDGPGRGYHRHGYRAGRRDFYLLYFVGRINE